MRILITLLLFLSIRSFALVLQVGETKTIPATGSVWVEKGSIVKIIDLGKHFEVKAIAPGESKIKVADEMIIINVLQPNQFETYSRLLKAAGQLLGIKPQLKSGKVLISGHLLRFEDWYKIAAQCEKSDCHYFMEATIHPELQRQIRKELSTIAKQEGILLPRIDFGSPYTLRLNHLSLRSQDLKQFASRYGIRIVEDKDSVDIAPLVKVHITVAEIKKDQTKKYGITWPSSYQAKILPAFQNSDDRTFILANFLEQNGIGKVLANPNILCRSGKEAEFFAGGEFPIPIINYKTKDVVWKKYGISMKVKPIADESGRMSISLETEVSSIDDSRKVDGIPGLYSNRIQSHFDLNESKTISLSGLIKSEEGEASDGLPGLSKIPVLGALFGSKEFREHRTELVIFVRPEIVNPDEE